MKFSQAPVLPASHGSPSSEGSESGLSSEAPLAAASLNFTVGHSIVAGERQLHHHLPNSLVPDTVNRVDAWRNYLRASAAAISMLFGGVAAEVAAEEPISMPAIRRSQEDPPPPQLNPFVASVQRSIPDIDTAIAEAREGRYKEVSVTTYEPLGPSYRIVYHNGGIAYLKYPSDEIAEKRSEFQRVLAQLDVPVEVTVDETSDKKLARKLAWLDLALLGVLGVVSAVMYRKMKREDPFKLEKSTTTFADVRGNPESVATLRGLIELLSRKSNTVGALAPRGILMVGEPGTGKTLMARATAGEMGYNFIAITGSDLGSPFLHVGVSKVRRLFQVARKNAPCILFIDEIEAVGSVRSERTDALSRENTKILTKLLTEMDGFVRNKGVLVMAATNRPDMLDPALVRPGRFDRTMRIEKPISVEQRAEIIDLYLERKKSEAVVDPSITAFEIARLTHGFSPAELSEVMNSAAFNALQLDKDRIDWDDVFEAIDRLVLGERLQLSNVTAQDEERIAFHEFFGHLVVGTLLEREIGKVSFLPRIKALAHVAFKAKPGIGLHTVSDYVQDLVLVLAGAAAEEISLGEYSNGAISDFNKARQLAEEMVTHNMLGFTLLSKDAVSEGRTLSADDRARAAVFLGEMYAVVCDTLRSIDLNAVKGLVAEIRGATSILGPKALELLEEHIGKDALKSARDKLNAGIREAVKRIGERRRGEHSRAGDMRPAALDLSVTAI